MSESSTEMVTAEHLALVQANLVGQDWAGIAAQLPADLEASARQTGALRRRRGIRSAEVLLRIVLAYAVLDWSLRLLGAWCVLQHLADISDVALLKRLRRCRPWLGHLLGQLLQQRRVRLQQASGVRLRVRDASVISRPGSTGTDWRVHLSLDLGRLCVDGVEVTDAHGAESLARLPTAPGEITLADAGYAFASGLGPHLAGQGLAVVRTNWQNLPLWRPDGQRLDPIAWLKSEFGDASRARQEITVDLATPQGLFRLRLLAGRLSEQAAERARRKARQTAQKKGHTLDARTLLACAFILLLTNLPARWWPAQSVLDLYRLRWQIELLFKRCKSLLDCDALRSQDPDLSQTYLLAKLLAVLLVEQAIAPLYAQLPDWFENEDRPVSVWRLTALLWQCLHQAICGPLDPQTLLASLPRLQRCLPSRYPWVCEPPRKRPQQLARARRFLSRLSVVNVLPASMLS